MKEKFSKKQNIKGIRKATNTIHSDSILLGETLVSESRFS